MIDEVMYGMMPSAKIVTRRKLPPLKRSKMPRTEPAARLGDLFLGGGAECMGVNGELGLQLAIAQNLDGIRCAANEAVCAQQIRRNRFARGEHVKFLEVDDGIRDAKRIVKPALRNAAMQRHLSAFETTAARIAAPGFLPLVAGAGSPAELRTHAAADAHFFLARALWRAEVRERNRVVFLLFLLVSHRLLHHFH